MFLIKKRVINYETILFLTCSPSYVIVAGTAANQVATFAITDTKLYVQVVTDQLKTIQNR